MVEAIDINLGFIVREFPEKDEGVQAMLEKQVERLLTFYNVVRAASGLAKLGAGAADKVLQIGSGHPW